MVGPEAEPAGLGRASFGRSDGLRVVSALVLAPVAIGAAYWGGWPYLIFWAAASLGILWEWTTLVRRSPALGPQPRGLWMTAGVVYAAALLAAAVILRRDAEWGFLAIMVLFGLVWATDIVAYFAGRLLQGPKLWPRVSPKKTWSGAVAGTVAAVLTAAAVAKVGGVAHVWPVGGLAVLLSITAQAGDLFESWVKRRCGAKDASHLIPGHGGIMDRLDGFLTAAAAAAVIGLAHGGWGAAARGLLVW